MIRHRIFLLFFINFFAASGAQARETKPKCVLVYHFIGCSSRSTNIANVLTVWKIEKRFFRTIA
jgi:hypothetical protein